MVMMMIEDVCTHHCCCYAQSRTFLLNRERAVDYLNMLDRVYVFDGFAGWDPASRIKIRVVCARVWVCIDWCRQQ